MTKRYTNEIVVSNKAQCLGCGDVIESLHRHDFKWCSCKSLAVDGGHDYLKRCFNENVDWVELSETYHEEREPYDWEK